MSDLAGVPFTQYMLPDGRRRSAVAPLDDPELQALADELMRKGVHFDAEILRTGEVSLTAELREDVLSILVIPQDRALAAVPQLLRDAAWALGYGHD